MKYIPLSIVCSFILLLYFFSQANADNVNSENKPLRNMPLAVPSYKVKQIFNLDENGKPKKYLKKNFKKLEEVVIDSVSGLMWQKSGSEELLTYKEGKSYVEKLNTHRFDSYSDWRFPTIEELISLLEPEKNANGLYIDLMFDKKQQICWSSDMAEDYSGFTYVISFEYGGLPGGHLFLARILSYFIEPSCYVRAVRSLK